MSAKILIWILRRSHFLDSNFEALEYFLDKLLKSAVNLRSQISKKILLQLARGNCDGYSQTTTD
ncbi:MAG: hypothetical protein KME05_21470 [Gloeocapsa sp. UFS-A4-WI-NPMV-4B04]|jgi:hypothetical protein|nr:hypothetical protein [Gloeocapsa sp. UFS-A4-WI-NPMV-4B04]